VVEDGDAVADLPAPHAPAHGGDGARHLVAVDAGRRLEPVLDLLQIGVADPAGGDLDQHLAGADGRNRDGFDGDLALPPVDGGLHLDGNHEGPRIGDVSLGGQE